MSDARDVPSWDEYFLNMSGLAKSKSRDRSSQVGCVIVGDGNSVLSMGYNGFPRGVRDNIEERHIRPLKYKFTEHAERNAIYNAARNGICLLGSRIYVHIWPCTDCARAIIQSGISKIIMDGRGYTENVRAWSERWEDDFDIAHSLLMEGSVFSVVWFPKTNGFGEHCTIANSYNWKSLEE